MYLFCHSSAAAVGSSTSWLCCWLVISHSTTLCSHCFFTFSAFICCLSAPHCSALQFIFPLCFYLCPPSPSLPPPHLSWSACLPRSARMTEPLPTFSILPLKSPYGSPALTTSVVGGILLSQSHTDTWVKPGRTTLEITWWINSSLQPSSTLYSLPHLPRPMTCSPLPGLFSSSLVSVDKAALNLARKVWGKETALFWMPFAPFLPQRLSFFPPLFIDELFTIVSLCHGLVFFRGERCRRPGFVQIKPILAIVFVLFCYGGDGGGSSCCHTF